MDYQKSDSYKSEDEYNVYSRKVIRQNTGPSQMCKMHDIVAGSMKNRHQMTKDLCFSSPRSGEISNDSNNDLQSLDKNIMFQSINKDDSNKLQFD